MHFFSLLSQDFQIALRNLLQHRKRTAFLGGAISAVTALFVLLNGLSAGVQETMIHTATTLMTGHVNVGGFYKITAGQAAPVLTDWKKIAEATKKALPEMDYMVERGRGWAKLVSDTGSMQVGIGGIDIGTEPAFTDVVQVVSGKIEDIAKPGTILIFENQAKKLDARVGDALTISAPTTRGTNNTIDVRVVAIAKDLGLLSSWNTYIPSESLRALYQLNRESTGAIHIHLKESAVKDSAVLAAKLRTGLVAAGYRMMDPDPNPFWMKFEKVSREDWTGQKLDVTTWEDELTFFSWTLQGIKGLSALLIIILLAIVVMGIMNTMWIAIRERTREIGTLRAIGMQRGRVLWMFLLESVLLGFVATLAGGAAGTGIALAANGAHLAIPQAAQIFLLSDHLFLAMHLGSVISAIVTITFVTGIAAAYPSLRAARLEPVTAMSHFG